LAKLVPWAARLANSAPSLGTFFGSTGSIGFGSSMVGDKEGTTKTNNNKPDEDG
jgi:hypothetical protein